MEQNMKHSMSDQEMMTDLLSSEKFMTSVYNTYCCEAATATVKSTLLSILQDEHRMQEGVFGEMSGRGWYQLEKAEEQKLNSTKQKFSKMATV